MNKLIIIGASGHGKVVADIAALNGYKDIVFLDNDSGIKTCAGYPVLGPDTMTSELDGDVFIAVGKAETRRKLMERDNGRSFPVLIHPSAVVAKSAEIGAGSVVMAGAVINPGAQIGKGCIIPEIIAVVYLYKINTPFGVGSCVFLLVAACSHSGSGAEIGAYIIVHSELKAL